MNAQTIIEMEWPYLLSFLPTDIDLETRARETGAFLRSREIKNATDLLRMVFVYGLCDLSLRNTAAWAEMAEVASISDVALMKRFAKCDVWLGELLGHKLAERACGSPPRDTGYRIRIVDATTISQPGSVGTDWRVHLGYDLQRMMIDHIELTDVRGGETFTRFEVREGDLIIGDRGYAHRRGLASVIDGGADFLVRSNWQNLPLQTLEGEPFSPLEFLRTLPDATAGEIQLQTAPVAKEGLAAIPCRLIAIRKSEAAAERSRLDTLKARSKKGRTIDPRTLEAAGYTMLVTSLPADRLSAEAALELYRFRWQIEIAFKRLKGLLNLDELPAKGPRLTRTYLYSKLLAALLLDDYTERFLGFSPWGYPVQNTAAIAVANSTGLDL